MDIAKHRGVLFITTSATHASFAKHVNAGVFEIKSNVHKREDFRATK